MRVRPSEITPERIWLKRRTFLGAALGTAAGASAHGLASGAEPEPLNTLEQISRYNNYYEFSTNKEVIWKLAEDFKPTVDADGRR